MQARLSPESTRRRPYAAPVSGLRRTLLLTGVCLVLAAAWPAGAPAAPPSKDEAIKLALRVPQGQRPLADGGQIRAAVSVQNDAYAVQFFDEAGDARAEVDLDLITG